MGSEEVQVWTESLKLFYKWAIETIIWGKARVKESFTTQMIKYDHMQRKCASWKMKNEKIEGTERNRQEYMWSKVKVVSTKYSNLELEGRTKHKLM